jgi:hydroxymethylpyrimidine pyrophosphatase-like HAD family hydrolase
MLELFITNSREQVIVALKREMEDQVRPYLDSGIRMEFNKASLMLVPANVSKGAGILAALRELRLEHETVMCLGDGENDLEMFRVCHVRVAVRNSVEVLKEQADYITTEDNGKGVTEAIDRYILDSRETSTTRSGPNET